MGPSATYIIWAGRCPLSERTALNLYVRARRLERGAEGLGLSFFSFCVVMALAALHDSGLLPIALELSYLECNGALRRMHRLS